jgi:HD-GYP domain-containing protein (c-di-GMP phosphodiesterase class II)
MPIQKKEVFVNELELGVFIAELDRPWTDTPFIFQGFILDNEEQLETLKKYCKKVVIDLEKGSDLPDRSQLKAGPITASRATAGPVTAGGRAKSVLATIKRTVTYEEKATVDAELPAARAARARTQTVLQDMFDTLQSGRALDASRVREAVASMTDSVVRNPDAMLLIAKLRQQSAHTLDRALGVSIYMITFGRFLQLPREQLDLLGMLGLLQDVGKTRVPEEVLNKKEPLNKVELALCRSHVEHSAAILTESPGLPPELPALAALHHERHDGSGYYKGMKGEEIGLFGSIAGMVDCFDALTHTRPYGEAMAPSNALNMLYGWRGGQFDGPLVEQFIQCIGIFPVGAIVELNSGEIGIVIAQNLVRRLQPRVMVVLDAKGNPKKPQLILDLSKEPRMDAETPYRIRRTLEKGSIAIDPSEFFL